MKDELRRAVKRFCHWLGHMIGRDYPITLNKQRTRWHCKTCGRYSPIDWSK